MFFPIIITWALNRLTEPSTYAGAAAIIAGANNTVPTDVMGSLQYVAMGVCGLFAVFMKERQHD